MPTTTQLQNLSSSQLGYLFIIDGCEVAWVTHADMDTLTTGDGRTLRNGLMIDGLEVSESIDIRDGMLEQVDATITVRDFVGDLPSLFAVWGVDDEPLGVEINPSTDLSAVPALFDANIGTERIGSAGERHQYPAPLGAYLPQRHIADSNADGVELAPAPVSSSPIVWNGRRVALYRCYRDHHTYPDRSTGVTSWRPLSEAVLVWWGTLRDAGSVDGRQWSFECDGPDSWLRRDLGSAYSRGPFSCVSIPNLPASQRLIGVSLRLNTPTSALFYGRSNFTDTLSGVDDVASWGQGIASAVGDASLDATGDTATAWVDEDGGVAFYDHALRMFVVGTAASAQGGVMYVVLHSRVWASLGFDIAVQSRLDQSDPLYVDFRPYSDEGGWHNLGPLGDAGDGYWIAAMPAGSSDPAAPGTIHTTQARFRQDVYALPFQPNDTATIYLGSQFDVSHIRNPGQLDAPPKADPSNASEPYPIGSGVNRQGLFIFRGRRRTDTGGIDETDAEYDETQVARCSWRDSNGLILGNEITITEWLEPGIFSIDRPRMNSDWLFLAGGIEVTPILHLGYSRGGTDALHHVVQRLLRTSGTSGGWYTDAPVYSDPAYSDDAVAGLEPGSNEWGIPAVMRHDGDDADVGLAIPDDVMQSPVQFADEVSALSAEQLTCKVVAEPGTNSEDVLRGLLQPMGLAMSLRGGRYGLIDVTRTLGSDDVQYVLDQSVKATDYDGKRKPLKIDLRAFQPIDKVTINTDYVPGDGYRRTRTFTSADRGKRYRQGAQEKSYDAIGVRPSTSWYERIAVVSRWYERRHFVIKAYPVMAAIVGDLHAGDVVAITEPSAIDPSGAYGVTSAIGRILSVRRRISYGQDEVDILVTPQTSGQSAPPHHAPSALVRGFDTDNERILVHDSWLGFENANDDEFGAIGFGTIGSAVIGNEYGGWSDASFFVEPSYIGADPFGGNAVIRLLQFDGSSWSFTSTMTVQSVQTTPGNSWIQVATLPGTYNVYAPSIVVMAPWDSQTAAWVRAVYCPIGDSVGVYGAGNDDVPRWGDV